MMDKTSRVRSRVATMVTNLNSDLEWGLSLAQRQVYVAALVNYVDTECTSEELQRIVHYYHQDHQVVSALQNQHNHEHDHIWQQQIEHITAILVHANAPSLDDGAVELDDLVQTVLAELVRSLPNYRYRSRFSTWLYALVVNRLQRMMRDKTTLKRKGYTLSLDSEPGMQAFTTEMHQPERQADATILQELIQHVLQHESDERLSYIFWLWAVQDQRLKDIGEQMNLSQTRVRLLVRRACVILQQSDALQDWRDLRA